jgi:hypothetical protein
MRTCLRKTAATGVVHATAADVVDGEILVVAVEAADSVANAAKAAVAEVDSVASAPAVHRAAIGSLSVNVMDNAATTVAARAAIAVAAAVATDEDSGAVMIAIADRDSRRRP